MIHLDTNVLLYIYDERTQIIPAPAQQRIETEALSFSPMVELELWYLWEIGRLTTPVDTVLGELAGALELNVSSAPFRSVVRIANSLSWTRDPFDRIIAAQSLADQADLITSDQTLRKHLPSAFWDQAPRSAR